MKKLVLYMIILVTLSALTTAVPAKAQDPINPFPDTRLTDILCNPLYPCQGYGSEQSFVFTPPAGAVRFQLTAIVIATGNPEPNEEFIVSASGTTQTINCNDPGDPPDMAACDGVIVITPLTGNVTVTVSHKASPMQFTGSGTVLLEGGWFAADPPTIDPPVGDQPRGSSHLVCVMADVWGLPDGFHTNPLSATDQVNLIRDKGAEVELGPINAAGNWTDGEIISFHYPVDVVQSFVLNIIYGPDGSWSAITCTPISVTEQTDPTEQDDCDDCGPRVDETPYNSEDVYVGRKWQFNGELFIESPQPFTVDGISAHRLEHNGVSTYYAYQVYPGATIEGLSDLVIDYGPCAPSVHLTQAHSNSNGDFGIYKLPGQYPSEWVEFGRAQGFSEEYIWENLAPLAEVTSDYSMVTINIALATQ